MYKRIILAVATVAIAATPALAVEVTKTANVGATPDKTWAAIGDFCGIATWHPAVAKCAPSKKGGKSIRTLTLKDGGVIVEELLGRDDAKMAYSYAIIESPLPVADYKSTIQVSAAGKGSKVTWSGYFEPKDAKPGAAKKVVRDIYSAGLKGIAEKSAM